MGSIVILNGGTQKIIIIARGMVAANFNPPLFFEYGGCFYPQGLIGDQIMYFNHEDISKIIFTGYSDDDNELMVDNINEWYEKSGFTKGNIEELKRTGSGLNVEQ